MDEADAIRRAKNEVLLRRYNEHVEAERLLTQPTLSEWVCECADEKCVQPVKLTIAEYEAVRAEPTHYLMGPLRRARGSGDRICRSPRAALVGRRKNRRGCRNQSTRTGTLSNVTVMAAGHGAPAIHV